MPAVAVEVPGLPGLVYWWACWEVAEGGCWCVACWSVLLVGLVVALVQNKSAEKKLVLRL